MRTWHSIEAMSHLNTVVVGDMGLLGDIPLKRGEAVLVRIDLQSAILWHLLRIHVGRERIKSVELCADDFDKVLEHKLGFCMSRRLQWGRVISLAENLRGNTHSLPF